jgi:DUF971 family protein
VNAAAAKAPRSGPEAHRPVEIVQRGKAGLTIHWADGHESTYPFVLLRRECRCAACRTSEPPPAGPKNPFRVLGPEPSAEPALLEPVGNYALGVTWRDQHGSIFAFDALRAACPCAECTAARKAAEP